MILAAAAFINSLLPNSPVAFGAPNRQNTAVQPTVEADTVTAAAVADAPRAFNYQGILRKPEGTLENGSFNMTLRLWDAVSGGNELFKEPHENVVVRDGVFEVILGDITPIDPGVLAISPLFLGITVGSDAEMQPRQRVNPVPIALTLVPGATVGGNLNVSSNLAIGGDTNINGNATIGGRLTMVGADFSIGAGEERGDGGRALVHAYGDGLIINFDNDFPGGTSVHSNLDVRGNLYVGGGLHLGGQKLCSAIVPGNWRDTILVSNEWKPETCASFGYAIGATQFQLACVFPDSFSWGGVNGGAPEPNCGW